MKVGDLVKFNPRENGRGALTAVKFFERLRKQTGDLPGIIVHDHGDNVHVAFGEKLVLINKNYLEIVNESR
tara:strand:+ start:265 stop:477 length:213 start_codon:yes stop_codon:yes gene_type:complete